MHYDYDRRVRTAAARIWVEKGKLIQISNVVYEARPAMMFDDCVVEEALEFQLYEESGGPAHGTYRGPGLIVDRGSEKFLIIGDAVRQANLPEYKIDKKPTRESDKRFNDVVDGVKAAIGEMKPGRRQKAKGEDWLRGYDEAMAYRKKVAPK